MSTKIVTTPALADSRSSGVASTFAGAIVAVRSAWANRRFEPTVAA